MQDEKRAGSGLSEPVRRWQPIGTAPKDGTVVLVRGKVGEWFASWRGPNRGEPQWDSHTEKEWREVDTGCWATPTEWMELPWERTSA